jgi:hypothetical protein
VPAVGGTVHAVDLAPVLEKAVLASGTHVLRASSTPVEGPGDGLPAGCALHRDARYCLPLMTVDVADAMTLPLDDDLQAPRVKVGLMTRLVPAAQLEAQATSRRQLLPSYVSAADAATMFARQHACASVLLDGGTCCGSPPCASIVTELMTIGLRDQ